MSTGERSMESDNKKNPAIPLVDYVCIVNPVQIVKY